MDKEEITFFCSVGVLLGGDRSHRRKHRCGIADASQSSSGTSAMDHPNHPRYYHIETGSPMCRRCVWDILNLGVPRRMLYTAQRCSMVLGEQVSGENVNACTEIFPVS